MAVCRGQTGSMIFLLMVQILSHSCRTTPLLHDNILMPGLAQQVLSPLQAARGRNLKDLVSSNDARHQLIPQQTTGQVCRHREGPRKPAHTPQIRSKAQVLGQLRTKRLNYWVTFQGFKMLSAEKAAEVPVAAIQHASVCVLSPAASNKKTWRNRPQSFVCLELWVGGPWILSMLSQISAVCTYCHPAFPA